MPMYRSAGKKRIRRMDVLVHPHCGTAGKSYDRVWRDSIDRLAGDREAGMVIFSKIWRPRELDKEILARKRSLIKYARNALGDRLIVTPSPKRVRAMAAGRGLEFDKKLDMTAYGMYDGHELLCVPRYGKALRDELKPKSFEIDGSRSVVTRAALSEKASR